MTLTGADPSLLRRFNSAAVLRALHSATSMSLTELVKTTNVSRATIEDVIADLAEQAWVEEVTPEAEGKRQVGRPAKRYRFRAEAGAVLGVDIGAHKVLAVAADLKGEIITVRRMNVSPDMSAPDRIRAAKTLIRRTLRTAGLEPVDVRGLGIGTVGVIDPAGQVVMSTRIPGWDGLDLVAEFRGLLGCPVHAMNDNNLAALAEHWRGVATGVDDVVYVLAGRRISAGLLLGGKIHFGKHGAAGEIGNMRAFGWYTALDRFADSSGGEPAEAAERVFQAVRDGDAKARRLVDSFARDLSKGIAATVLTVDPELVVIGGGLSKAGLLITEPLSRRLQELCLFPIRVEASVLADESVALGALRLALDHVERALFEVS